jgi:tetratricopeptide (TPR) repeat protein
LLALALAELASCLVARGNQPEAIALVKEAFPLTSGGALLDDRRRYQLYMILAESYLYEQALEPALASFQKALAIAERREGDMAQEHFEVSFRLATTLLWLERATDADRVLETALTVALRHQDQVKRFKAAIELRHAYPRATRWLSFKRLLDSMPLVARELDAESGAPTHLPVYDFFSTTELEEQLDTSASTEAAPTEQPPAAAPADAKQDRNVLIQRVEELRPRFKSCYKNVLRDRPQAEGRGYITLEVDLDGRAHALQGVAVALPAELLDCALLQVHTHFKAPPRNQPTYIAIPLTFVYEPHSTPARGTAKPP